MLELANEVKIWLEAIGYEITEQKWYDNRTYDMIATISGGTIYQKVLVRCLGGEISSDDVKKVYERLDRRVPQAWLISDRRVSQKAKEYCESEPSMQVFNLAQFLQEKIWSNYIKTINKVVKDSRIPELYVDTNCCRKEINDKDAQIVDSREGSLIKYIDNWLDERGKVHISLLGDFGSGKTWFCRYYADKQLKKYLDNPSKERFPLLITLRDFVKASTMQQLVNDALLEQYKLPFLGGAYKVFEEMNKNGKLLLILDGFDEMARKADYQTVVDNFWNLQELVSEKSKVILTSRTEYFRWAKETEKIFSGIESGKKTIVLSDPKFEVVYIEPFTNEQISLVIEKIYGETKGKIKADTILKNKNLSEMARKPVLIELLLAALEEVDEDKLTNISHVYLYATNKLLLKNITEQRTFTSTKDKLFFLCELAWEMIKSRELKIHYKQIPEIIKSYFNEKIKDQHELDNWDYDLRSQTLLHNNLAGYYEFAHKSLAEYFVAYKFACEINCLSEVFKRTYCDLNGSPCEVPYLQKDINELSSSFGANLFEDRENKAIKDFITGMIDENSVENLWDIIYNTRGKNFDEVKFAGSNAVKLLKNLRKLFKDRDFSNTVLVKSDFSKLDLSRAIFENANLAETNFEFSILAGANFKSSNLDGASFNSATLFNVNFEDANLENIHIEEPITTSIYWSQDNDLIISNNYSDIKILNSNGKEIEGKICDKYSFVNYIVWSKEKNIVAVIMNNVIKLLDPTSFKCLKEVKYKEEMINRLYLSPSQRYISTSHGESSSAKVWDLKTLRELNSINTKTGWCNSAVFLNNEDYIILTGYRGEIIKWNWKTNQSVLIHKINNSSNAYDLCFNSNQDKIAVINSSANKVNIWSFPDFNQEREISFDEHSNIKQIRRMDFNKDGDKIAVIISEKGEYKLKLLLLMENQLYDVYDLFTSKEYIPSFNIMKFSPNGSLLALGVDSEVGLWNVNTEDDDFGKCVKTISATPKCQGLNIKGAKGLSSTIEWVENFEVKKGKLETFFAKIGAICE